jgi:copper chaperone
MVELKVHGMTCGHCVATVKAAVLEVAPTARTEVEIASGAVRIEGDVDAARVRDAIERAGYSIE